MSSSPVEVQTSADRKSFTFAVVARLGGPECYDSFPSQLMWMTDELHHIVISER
jgi:hypothetical protein